MRRGFLAALIFWPAAAATCAPLATKDYVDKMDAQITTNVEARVSAKLDRADFGAYTNRAGAEIAAATNSLSARVRADVASATNAVTALSIGALTNEVDPVAGPLLSAHAADTNNPHAVTAKQAGAVARAGSQSVAGDWGIYADGFQLNAPLGYLDMWSSNIDLGYGPRSYEVRAGQGRVRVTEYPPNEEMRWVEMTSRGLGMCTGWHSYGAEYGYSLPLSSGTLALRSDVASATNAVVAAKELHWDESSQILWRTVISNGYWYTIAVTNTPTLN